MAVEKFIDGDGRDECFWHREVVVKSGYLDQLDRTVFFAVMPVVDEDSEFYDADVPWQDVLLRYWVYGAFHSGDDVPKGLIEELDSLCDSWYGEGKSAPEGFLKKRFSGKE